MTKGIALSFPAETEIVMETQKIKWLEEYLDHALEVAWMEGSDRALRLLDRLLYEEPGYGRLHYVLGVVYYRYADEPVLAEKYFRFAIKFNPELTDAYHLLVEILRNDERFDEVILVCRQGLKVRKADKALLLENQGNAWELKQKYRRAIRTYRKALRSSAELWRCRMLEENIKRCKRKQD